MIQNVTLTENTRVLTTNNDNYKIQHLSES